MLEPNLAGCTLKTVWEPLLSTAQALGEMGEFNAAPWHNQGKISQEMGDLSQPGFLLQV